MAKHLGLEVIHCSENDTQVAHNYKDDKVFINTWSCIGLLEESLVPVQLGWGTHEKTLPDKAEHLGPNALAVNVPAYQKWHKSCVPNQEIEGFLIPHGEAVTLPQYLASPGYCPT